MSMHVKMHVKVYVNIYIQGLAPRGVQMDCMFWWSRHRRFRRAGLPVGGHPKGGDDAGPVRGLDGGGFGLFSDPWLGSADPWLL